MTAAANQILEHLARVEEERSKRSMTPGLSERVVALKAFQQARFAQTYSDLAATVRYGAAVRFFLDELYGPSDFTRRDAQFARVVPGLVRLFPAEIVQTVETLAELHSLSERLDTLMAQGLPSTQIGAAQYIQAWQHTGRSAERNAQISLTLSIARRLDHFTHKPLLRTSLRLMRGPARAAGLAELQRFLESGFDTFQAMKGAQEFLQVIEGREHRFVSAMFEASSDLDGGRDIRQSAFELLPK